MLNQTRTLVIYGLSAALVAALGGLGWSQLRLSSCKLDAAETRHAYAVATVELLQLRQQRDAAQTLRDQALERLDIEKGRERDNDVEYVTREVVRYVESPAPKCELPVEWVCLYNAAAGDTRPCPATGTSAPAASAAGNTAATASRGE